MNTTEAIKERPIPFRPEMVRAILNGSKTQTRRIVKPQSIEGEPIARIRKIFMGEELPDNQWWAATREGEMCDLKCPYGKIGDRLWVKETWAKVGDNDDDIHACPNLSVHAYYRADVACPEDLKWRPSIFMPRWASRITLEITSIRVERLQDISPEDCVAEGIVPDMETHAGQYWRESAVSGYQSLWESIHGAGSWEANPWLWVISFKRLEAS